ncbi:hypothetical protein ACQ4PT_030823 [Festuca glaucescens]
MESSPAPSVDKSHFYAMIEYSINANPGSLESDLVQAIQDGDVDDLKGNEGVVRLLLSRGARVDIAVAHGTPLHIAASYGKTSVLKILLDHHADDESYHKIDRIAELKYQGKKAVKRNDFLGASNLYTKALALNYFDETLYSNRSLCYLKIGKAREALFDADVCIAKRPEWVKGYYRKGAAHMSLKEYEEASEAFQDGLELDPGNAEMEKLLW